MSYQVLARKYRPGDFSSLVGQSHVVRALMHTLDSQRLHHAYLFTGTRGVGKTTVARILAKALNCEAGVSASPCGQCSSCIGIAEGRFPDLIELDAASRTGVDSTRDLIDNAQYLPTQGRFKVYIIDEVHMLTNSSFNALLKTLEEPPEHVKFLLATTDPKKIPVTVLSRCLQFQLKNMLPDTIAGYLSDVLQREEIPFEAGALALIARAARGSMRDALSLTDQALVFGGGRIVASDVSDMLGAIDDGLVVRLLGLLADNDGQALLALCRDMAGQAVDFAEVLNSLLLAVHELAVIQAVGAQDDHDPEVADLAGRMPPEIVQLHYQILLNGLRDLPLAPDPQCGFEMVMLRLLAFTPVAAPGLGQAPRLSKETRPGSTKPGPEPPGNGLRAGVERAVAGPVSTGAATPVTPAAPVRPAPPPVEAAEATPASDVGPLVERWYQLAAELPLGGVAKMIVDNAVPESVAGSVWHLCLDPAHDTLLNDRLKATIEAALSEQLDSEVRLQISIMSPSAETPAQRRERLEAQRQADALARLQADRHVQALIEVFEAQLHPDSVRPLGTKPTASDI
jgi:DNA polymerase III subunit gamma/tau